MQSFLGSELLKGLGSWILTLLGRLDLTRSLIALAIIVASMGWGFSVASTAPGVEFDPGISGRLRWIGRGAWGGLVGCRHVEYFRNRC